MKGQAIGEVNPDITQALGKVVAPYVAEMVGAPQAFTGNNGFAGPPGNEGFGIDNASRLFSVIDSNADAAAYLNAQAFGMSAQLEQAWAVGGHDPENWARNTARGRDAFRGSSTRASISSSTTDWAMPLPKIRQDSRTKASRTTPSVLRLERVSSSSRGPAP